ncbi:hypothetical protein, partial [Escherichia coli]|uniref:hypothetical protein n=1 Tax=Escherichia coli TaxID=562 RepID=UPI001945A3C7
DGQRLPPQGYAADEECPVVKAPALPLAFFNSPVNRKLQQFFSPFSGIVGHLPILLAIISRQCPVNKTE